MFTICMASWFVIVPLARLSYQLIELPGIALGKRVDPFQRLKRVA
jgi:peptidoglycan/LPS O-acetylase OafA/YrhL